ncbi:MAG: class II D-tagatose-bisphosphate aldolase non-catalytic subunit [Bacteroidales bacterium]
MNVQLRETAVKSGKPLVVYLMEEMRRLEQQTGIRRTLLAVCPNSLGVIRAALRAAKRWDAPIKFAATLNQVDVDGGYTRLSQQELVQFIHTEAARIHLQVPVIIAIDHGGPWLKDQHAREQWSFEETMNAVKKSFEAAIAAGYDLIHVDPTVDITLPRGVNISIETVAERTAELIRHAEWFRRSHGYPPIAYEVGTEEVHGGLADLQVFRTFLQLLKKLLREAKLEDVWPVFVVGKVGTDLHTTEFDPEVARKLVAEAGAYGSFIKGHYTDNVDHPELYPMSGIGAANVGPEFTEREYEALEELSLIQDKLFEQGRVPAKIPILSLLRQAVLASGRWKKWLQPGEDPQYFDSLSSERQQWLIKTGCRYIWENPEIVAARCRLFENLRLLGIDPEAILDAHLQKTLDKYFYNFNLKGFNALINQQISTYAQNI